MCILTKWIKLKHTYLVMPIVAYPFTDQQFSSTKLTPASDIKTPLNNTLNEVLMNSGCVLRLPMYLFYTSLMSSLWYPFIVALNCFYPRLGIKHRCVVTVIRLLDVAHLLYVLLIKLLVDSVNVRRRGMLIYK